MTGKVIELVSAVLADHAEILRNVAKEIDEGKHGDVRAVAVVVDGNELALFGSGDADQFKMVWMLEAAKQELLP